MAHDQVRSLRNQGWAWFDYAVLDEYGPLIKAEGIAVYMVLARHADNNTQQSFPAVASIATKINMSERQVKRILKRLEDVGLITITAQHDEAGRQLSNLYTLQPVSKMSYRGDYQSPSGVTTSHGGEDSQSPKQNSVNKTHRNKTESSAGATPQARKPRSAHRDMERDIPPADPPGFDFKGLWAIIEDNTGRKLLWNWAAETQAVKRILKAYPAADAETLTRFLAYLETVFPWSQDPTKQPTFSEGAKHFAKWYSGAQPAALAQKGSTPHGRTYESPGERREREWMESIASIYGPGSAPGDHRGATEPEPLALPARSPETRIISYDRRRVG